MQRILNETFDLELTIDGNIGKVTQSAIERFQRRHNLDEKDDKGYCYGVAMQSLVAPLIRSRFLEEVDYVNAAAQLGVEIAAVKAIAKTESKEYGFLDNGFPVILFERHHFYRYMVNKDSVVKANEIMEDYPHICNPKPGGYLGKKAEIDRFKKASSIDLTYAILSTSWGMFQLMGSNYSICGYPTPELFVAAMKQSEKNHLKAFVYFIKSNRSLKEALDNKDWKNVARLYNGPNYAINQYDVKLKENYDKFRL